MERVIFNLEPELVEGRYKLGQLVIDINQFSFNYIIEPRLRQPSEDSYSYQFVQGDETGRVLEGDDVKKVWRECQDVLIIDPLDTRVPMNLVHVRKEENEPSR